MIFWTLGSVPEPHFFMGPLILTSIVKCNINRVYLERYICHSKNYYVEETPGAQVLDAEEVFVGTLISVLN